MKLKEIDFWVFVFLGQVKLQILGYETAKALSNLLEGKEIEMGKFLEAELQEGESCDRVVRMGQDRALT